MANAKHTLFLLIFTGSALAGCSFTPTIQNSGSTGQNTSPKIVVLVEDETDKAYISEVGDISAFYRDIATQVVAWLNGSGVPASTFDSPDSQTLVIRLRRIQVINNVGQILQVKTEFSADLNDWRGLYNNDLVAQLPFGGSATPADLRDRLSRHVSYSITSDTGFLRATQ